MPRFGGSTATGSRAERKAIERRRDPARIVLTLAIATALGATAPARGASITIVNLDGPGEGFNDATPVAPMGGNPGTTVGAQRMFVFEYAANLWRDLLPTDVEVRVNANFNPQSCDSVSGVLGSAGPTYLFKDFPNAPVAGHWYHVALANKLAGSDLVAGTNDINAQFNSSVGGANCLNVGWYYGVDGNEGNQIELLPVVLHELGHGLGFSTSTSGSSGSYNSGFPHIWDRYLYDNGVGLHWDQMTAGQRAASAIACSRLVWDGTYTTSHAPGILADKPMARVNAPAGIAGEYEVGLAGFGTPLNAVGVTANVVQGLDGSGVTTDCCEALTNGAAIAGKIALIDRGNCPFVVKVKNAQNAGAVGVIIVDNVASCPPAAIGGTDATVVIPSVRITQADGNTFKSNLGSGLNVTLVLDPARQAGADAAGRVRMYAPMAYVPGSSVSHFDVLANPDLLMEPAINGSISSDVDLTKWLFADIGWFDGALEVLDPPPLAVRLEPNAPNPFSENTAIRFSLDRQQGVDLDVYDLNGRHVAELHRGALDAGPHVIEWNGRDLDGRPAAPGIYLYRLRSARGPVESRHMVLMR